MVRDEGHASLDPVHAGLYRRHDRVHLGLWMTCFVKHPSRGAGPGHSLCKIIDLFQIGWRSFGCLAIFFDSIVPQVRKIGDAIARGWSAISFSRVGFSVITFI